LSTINQDFIAVALSFRGKYDACDIINVWLTNMPVLDETFPLGYFPIIESIQGIGTQQDILFPKATTGTIRLDNSRDSLTFQKRLTDLACNYVIQGSCIRIYNACNDAKKNEFFEDRNVVWEGEIEGIVYNTTAKQNNQKVTISVRPIENEHTVTKQLNINNFPDLPDRNKNKFLPLVVGDNVQVQPYALRGDVADQIQLIPNIDWAYATNLEGTADGRFRNSGIRQILAADLDTSEDGTQEQEYKRVVTAPTINTPLYPVPAAALGATTNRVNRNLAFPIGYDPNDINNKFVVTGVRIYGLRGQSGAAAPEGELSIRIYSQRRNRVRPKPTNDHLAEAIVVKEEYTAQWQGAGVFDVVAQFDKPVPFVADTFYWLGIQGSNEDDVNSLTEINLHTMPAQPNTRRFATTDDPNRNNQNTWVKRSGVENRTIRFEFFGMVFEDVPEGNATPDEDGLGCSYVTTTYNPLNAFTTDGGRLFIDQLDRFDFLLEIGGLADTEGFLTSFPNTTLLSAHHQIAALFHQYNGTFWREGNFDRNRFIDTHVQYTDVAQQFFRRNDGRTYNKASNFDVIRELCRNSYSTLVYDAFGRTGRYSLLAHGLTRDSVLTVDDNDALVEKFSVNRLNTVVNHIRMNYDRRLDSVHFQSLVDQEEARGYGQTLNLDPRDGGVGQQLSELSFIHYGEKSLTNENFDYLKDAQSVQSVAELYLRLHDHPFDIVQLVLPFCAFNQLRMYDRITLHSTEVPNISGTSPNYYSNPDECGISGIEITQVKDIDLEILALTFVYTARSKPLIRLHGRLLNHLNDPLNEFQPLT